MITRRIHTAYLSRCYFCGRLGHDIYHVTINGSNYTVCGNPHALELEKKLEEDGQS